MSARDRLTEALKNPGLVGLCEEEAAELVDAYAHELAEQQRAWIADQTDMPWWADEIADVIDPEKSAGPVRPDEEPPAVHVTLDNSNAKFTPTQPLKPHYPDEGPTP